jgi:hypothetical protein
VDSGQWSVTEDLQANQVAMKEKTENSDQERLVEEIEAKQRNIDWPDAMKNSSSVDEFLWKGSPDAPLVQRMGAWIFGLTFMLMGLCLFDIAYEKQDRACGIFSLLPFFLGVKVFLNGFRKHKAAKHNPE